MLKILPPFVHNHTRKTQVLYLALFLILGLVTLKTPPLIHAQLNAGLVSGIWYSQPTFFAGEEIRIYAAIQNQSDQDITGEAVFYINDKLIGTSAVSISSGRLGEAWVDHAFEKGSQTIEVKLINTESSQPGQPQQTSDLSRTTMAVTLEVDSDVDGDDIGDSQDDDITASPTTTSDVDKTTSSSSSQNETTSEKNEDGQSGSAFQPFTEALSPLSQQLGGGKTLGSIQEAAEPITNDLLNTLDNQRSAIDADLSQRGTVGDVLRPVVGVLFIVLHWVVRHWIEVGIGTLFLLAIRKLLRRKLVGSSPLIRI